MTITGHCHCGQITYAAREPILKSTYCDCSGCQRATGTLHAPFVTVLRDNFAVTAGQPARFRAQSGERCDAVGDWFFCPSCGTHVYWLGDHSNELDIFAGSLDDKSLFQAEA
jgi:hypothetical protein